MASIPQPPKTSFTDESLVLVGVSESEPSTKKHRVSGRKRDPVWNFTTVYADKRVVCNRCGALIHRYGVAKVERVRNHFERKCPDVQEQAEILRDEEGDAFEVQTDVGPDILLKHHKAMAIGSSYGNKSNAFKRKFAYWLYATGQPFDNAENELLASALKVLRGGVALPTKHELENELLDLEFTASKNKVTKALSGKKCCLTIENLVEAGGFTAFTYGVMCEGALYYLEAKTTMIQESRGELTADEVEEVMAKEKKAEFYGIVTPTTSTLSKYTRKRIQKKHPRCTFFHGCVISALTLLLSDVCTVLPWLEKIQTSVVELAQVFHGNYKLQTLATAAEHNQTMKFPDNSSICALLEALLKHEKTLYMIVARRDFVDASTLTEQEQLKRVQDFVLGETFAQDLINSLAVLRPLQQQLNRFQKNRPSLSQVFPCFIEFLTVYSSMEWVSKKEKALITSCVTERFNAIYGDSHGVAYMLDPLYLGESLDERKKQEVESFISRFCEHEGHIVDISTQLEQYKAMVDELKQNNSAFWELLQSGAVSPHDFWIERRGQFPHLHQLAVAVFSLPASSSSPAPSFGVQGFTVHSRFSRALPLGQLEKLTHVYCNSKEELLRPV
ncbi:unnamed protein product [Peronospora effusa]|uniref:BED-type domain-containing protein n=1 Tax=Peronospora effusa TaxID=542832 RepID=A0A3M6VND5_9STRA|nr:hypothetical protein DD238_008066 [Peronospora effusa]RQM12357.1 hypothetical protein DD237_008496 [Peronospora effusa]CAI5726362.1 unnamed protein product [Peronospora effusa]